MGVVVVVDDGVGGVRQQKHQWVLCYGLIY
jgi:hypothetical protein